MDDTKEIVGFLARWTLLGLAALMVAVMVWTLSVATVGASTHAGALSVSDMLWMKDGDIDYVALGLIRPTPPPAHPVLCQGPGDRLWQGHLRPDGAHVHVAGPFRGVNTVNLRGMPYDRRAFQQCRAIVLVTPVDQRVFLLSAGEYDFAAASDRDRAGELLAAVEPLGAVAWLFAGRPDAFAATREHLRAISPTAPVVYLSATAPIGRDGLRVFLRRSYARHAPTTLVTHDAAVAAVAGNLHLETHLIGDDRAMSLRESVHRHESVAKFKDSLPSAPIQP